MGLASALDVGLQRLRPGADLLVLGGQGRMGLASALDVGLQRLRPGADLLVLGGEQRMRFARTVHVGLQRPRPRAHRRVLGRELGVRRACALHVGLQRLGPRRGLVVRGPGGLGRLASLAELGREPLAPRGDLVVLLVEALVLGLHAAQLRIDVPRPAGGAAIVLDEVVVRELHDRGVELRQVLGARRGERHEVDRLLELRCAGNHLGAEVDPGAERCRRLVEALEERAHHQPLPEVPHRGKALLQERVQLREVELLHVEGIGLVRLRLVDRAVGRGDHEHAGGAQHAAQLRQHLALLAQVLDGLERDHDVEARGLERQVESARLLEAQSAHALVLARGVAHRPPSSCRRRPRSSRPRARSGRSRSPRRRRCRARPCPPQVPGPPRSGGSAPGGSRPPRWGRTARR
jgi:hypothetical protein